MTDWSDIANIVDTDRYPLHDPDGPVVAALLDEGRDALAQDALFTLPDFVRPEAVEAMAGEIENRVPQSCRFETDRPAYDWQDGDWPADHPRRIRHRFSYNQIMNHQIANDSPLRRLYVWEPMRDFLRRLMGYETFYRSECPHLALCAKVASQGDTDGWHFDSNDVVFSVLLQKPEGGGLFEYSPNIRSDNEQNYDSVRAVFDGRSAPSIARLEPGALNVFQGDQTLHRVSPVEGDRPRIVGLFAFDRDPGMSFEESYIRELRGQLPA